MTIVKGKDIYLNKRMLLEHLEEFGPETLVSPLWVEPYHQNDRDVGIVFMRVNGNFINFTPEKFRNDPEIVSLIQIAE